MGDEFLSGGFIKVAEAAMFLGVSRSTLYLMMDRGALAYAKFGRSRRLQKSALIQYAQSHVIGGWSGTGNVVNGNG